ncbi:blue copper protein-like [Apium graveolens]|uniref:blue copper protein-like n=1 Tax=Apium graveolens TaxID=4045 RepID=UPI003D7B892C
MAFAAVCLIITLLAVPSVYAVDHIVGDRSGWSRGINYSQWASGKKFAVGDNLVFSYGSSDSVDKVRRSDYESCTAGNALKAYKGGNNTVPLKSLGSMYFICPVFGHCVAGMKLRIIVKAFDPTSAAAPSTTKDSYNGSGGFGNMIS